MQRGQDVAQVAHRVFREPGGPVVARLVQTQLRTHRLRWYHKHEFAMMLESVGFREVAVQCGYTDSDKANPEAEWIVIAKR